MIWWYFCKYQKILLLFFVFFQSKNLYLQKIAFQICQQWDSLHHHYEKIEISVHNKGFTFYTSHVADPLPAQVGLAVLATIEKENLINRAADSGGYLKGLLKDLQQKYLIAISQLLHDQDNLKLLVPQYL